MLRRRTNANATNEDEEDGNVQYGQSFVSRVVNAVMTGPQWQHTLLIWLYDEHGGCFHDHTSVLAEIEELWNLPALTYRDANATDLSDFLSVGHPSFMTPPTLAAPSAINPTACRDAG